VAVRVVLTPFYLIRLGFGLIVCLEVRVGARARARVNVVL
jgi:hypothetical protein